MVATNWILSMTADRSAEIHKMIVAAATRLPPVNVTSLPPTKRQKIAGRDGVHYHEQADSCALIEQTDDDDRHRGDSATIA
jgi:hypothetical protein